LLEFGEDKDEVEDEDEEKSGFFRGPALSLFANEGFTVTN
jgi:hypothetical protein